MSHTSKNRPSRPDIGHPIAVVAERTGLSRDVLRVWERRYGAVQPSRTPGGQRVYTDADVERFRLLAAATANGRSISAVAGIPSDELASLVERDEAARASAPAAVPAAAGSAAEVAAIIDDAMRHTRDFDGMALDHLLRRAIARHGLPAFLEEVVPHLMQRVGDGWRANELTVAQEHLASAAVVAILLETMRSLPGAPAARRILVATPSGELHGVGAALAATAAALDGWSVVYLGVDVPAPDIVSAATSTDAHAVLLSVVHADDPETLVQRLEVLRSRLPAGIPILIGGAAGERAADRITATGLIVCRTFADMRAALGRERVAA